MGKKVSSRNQFDIPELVIGFTLGSQTLVVSPLQKLVDGASQVAQWLRICLLMQGTRVRALAWEDPTCRRAAGPVSHNC